MRRSSALAESAMVKGGHSASAAAGSKSFSASHLWLAGQSFIGPAQGDPLETELSLYYRDSFFLLLRGDASKVADVPTAYCEAETDGVAKARKIVRRLASTEKALKRPISSVIDLTDD